MGVARPPACLQVCAFVAPPPLQTTASLLPACPHTHPLPPSARAPNDTRASPRCSVRAGTATPSWRRAPPPPTSPPCAPRCWPVRRSTPPSCASYTRGATPATPLRCTPLALAALCSCCCASPCAATVSRRQRGVGRGAPRHRPARDTVEAGRRRWWLVGSAGGEDRRRQLPSAPPRDHPTLTLSTHTRSFPAPLPPLRQAFATEGRCPRSRARRWMPPSRWQPPRCRPSCGGGTSCSSACCARALAPSSLPC